MSLFQRAAQGIGEMWRTVFPSAGRPSGERGVRVPGDVALQRLLKTMFVDHERRSLVNLVRQMDLQDGRVKRVHNRTARDTIRGGLVLQLSEKSSSQTLKDEWARFASRLQLSSSEKLKSDARGFLMEGNLALQLVLDADAPQVLAAIRMPSDTLVPMVDLSGRFLDPANAWEQRDVTTGQVQARFAAWQMGMARLDPDNFDDMGSMGRPLLDACATTWRKLVATEEDLVIRRHFRAPLRMAHVLEGADETEIQRYRKRTEGEKGEIATDYYLNRRGGVQAVQGDATLGDIGDVVHLLDTFFAGSPAPKGLFGYVGDLSRDILEDLKRDYYDEVDGVQDCLAGVYAFGFRIHLLFRGIDPAPDEFTLRFAQRRTETANQVADLALKYMALGLPDDWILEEMAIDPDRIARMRKNEAARGDPYPDPTRANRGNATRVSVTPGNARKGESGTSVGLPGSNAGRGRG